MTETRYNPWLHRIALLTAAPIPLAGPVFQTTKADDGSGNYLYMVNPQTDAVSRVGPYLGI